MTIWICEHVWCDGEILLRAQGPVVGWSLDDMPGEAFHLAPVHADLWGGPEQEPDPFTADDANLIAAWTQTADSALVRAAGERLRVFLSGYVSLLEAR